MYPHVYTDILVLLYVPQEVQEEMSTILGSDQYTLVGYARYLQIGVGELAARICVSVDVVQQKQRRKRRTTTVD